jgi:hypothetical protein
MQKKKKKKKENATIIVNRIAISQTGRNISQDTRPS